MNDTPQPPNPLLEGSAPEAVQTPGATRGSDAMERVLTELIRDRRAERRWRSVFRLAWLLVAIALIWTVAPTRGLHSAPAGPHTALVDLRGEISAEGLA